MLFVKIMGYERSFMNSSIIHIWWRHSTYADRFLLCKVIVEVRSCIKSLYLVIGVFFYDFETTEGHGFKKDRNIVNVTK